jgi:hypothetical protein
MDRFLQLAMVVVVVIATTRLRLTSRAYRHTIWQRPDIAPFEPADGGVVLVPDTRRALVDAVFSSIAAIGLSAILALAVVAEGPPGPLVASFFGLVWVLMVVTAFHETATYRALRRLDALTTITPNAITHHRSGAVIVIDDLAEVAVGRSILGAESVQFRSTSDTEIRVNLRHAAVRGPHGPGRPKIRPILSALPREGWVII